MSCSSKPFSVTSGIIPQILNAADSQNVTYLGNWTTAQADQQLFQVSKTKGDRATIVFTGSSIKVFGQMNSDGAPHGVALFGIDKDGLENGGVMCESPTNSSPDNELEENLLFDSISGHLQRDPHTLFITNEGGTISLDLFLVFGGGETTSSAHPAFPSTALPLSTSRVVSGSIPSTSNSMSQALETPPSPTFLSVPLFPSTAPTLSDTQRESTPLYTISSYTEVSIASGSTATIVIQTTVEVSATPRLHGVPKDVLEGAVVGGALLLLVLVGIGLWWRRRRHRLVSLKDVASLDSEPVMTPGVTTLVTQDVYLPEPPTEPTSRSPGAATRSRKHTLQSRGDAALSPSESGDEDSGQPSDQTAPHIFSTIAEASLILEDVPSKPAVDADPQVVATNTGAKQDSDATSAVDPNFQASPPAVVDGRGRGGAPDTVTFAGDEGNVERGRARVRRLLVEEDSGVRLAGGRSGESAPGEDTGSGEWEVLPPPYQEF